MRTFSFFMGSIEASVLGQGENFHFFMGSREASVLGQGENFHFLWVVERPQSQVKMKGLSVYCE